MGFKKYTAISKIEFKQSFQYLFDFILTAFFVVVILFVFTNLWKTIYAGKEIVAGFTLPMMIWYLAFTESITMGIGWKKLFEHVSDEVKSGEVSNYLTKPLSYVGWHLSKLLSNFVILFTTVLLIGGIICFIFVGPISFSYLQILPILVLLILSFILSFTVGMSFSLLAFWFEDVTALYWILQKGLFILGGMIVPLDVYPAIITKYLSYLPFGFITYGPGKYFVTGDFSVFTSTIKGQIIWSVIFGFLTWFIYKLAVRRLNVHGG